MNIDSIFLKQFNANNKFIDSMICSINNYLKTSDRAKLLSCCEMICDNEETFTENNQILNYLKEKMDILKSDLNRLDIESYYFDTIEIFNLLVTYSNSIINNESEEKTKVIYNDLMKTYDEYTLYKSKF